MGLIRDLQGEHYEWVNHNFPDQQPHHAVYGMVEEIGELCHALLKGEQRIREGVDEGFKVNIIEEDAIGDLFIYMMSHANFRGLDLEEIITTVWFQVKERDWIAYPDKGVPNDTPAG
jgi:NTP pyrophosphatase (non-canonical NTP hydrolase)